LGDSFGSFSFGQTQLGGLFLDFNFKNFMGALSKGLLLDFFWPIVVWAHLRDLFKSFFGHTFKLLGTFFFPWAHLKNQFGLRHISRAHFKDLFGLSLKYPCQKAFLKDLLNPKHLGMLK
jgi:hypothetical protein